MLSDLSGMLFCLVILVISDVTAQSLGVKLVGSGAVGAARQGSSVAISGNGAVIASGGYEDNSLIGATWIFTLNTASGVYTQKLSKVVQDYYLNSFFGQGYSISLSEDSSILASGGYYDNSDIGAVWVFTLNGMYAQQGLKLVGSGSVGSRVYQGYSISLSANGAILASGGYYDNSGVGAVWIFINIGGIYSQLGSKLMGNGSVGSNVYQGYSISLSADGTVLASGGCYDNYGDGAVWIFTRNTATSMYAQQGSKLVGSGAIGHAQQGYSVFISANGTILASGGCGDNSNIGAVWIFTFNASTGSFNQKGTKLVGSGAIGRSYQGCSVSLSANGTVIASGGYQDNSYIGAIWIFTLNIATGIYIQKGSKIVASGAIGAAWQGYSVSLSASGTVLVSGGINDNSGAGAVWVFNINSPTPCILPTNTASTIYTTQCASVTQNGTSCTPVCSTGYSANASLTIICLNGSFTLPIGTCNPNPCNIPSNSISTIYTSTCLLSTPSSQSCTPICNNGYSPNASLTIDCFAGLFSMPSGTCNPKPCLRPLDTPSTIYTQASCPLSTLSGSICTPTCQQGYTSNGSLSLTCTLGNFSSPIGYCDPNPCSRPSDTSSTLFSSTCSSFVPSGSSCYPICTPGYSPSGDISIACLAGAFSFANGDCLPNPCLPQTTIYPTTTGSCSTTTPSGAQCILGCVPGYVVNGSLAITCTKGNFSSPTGYCYYDTSKLLCSQPTPSSPKTPGNCPSASQNGTQCSLGCLNGYTPSGNPNVTCVNQTFYNNLSFVCLQNPCQLPNLPNGIKQGNCQTLQPANTSCEYACSEGYIQEGPLGVICSAGSYSQPIGSCQPSPCFQPVIDSSSAKTIGNCAAITPSNTSCILGCIDGFTPIGDMHINCDRGNFSTNYGYCIGVNNIFTSTTSLRNNPPLIASPGTRLSIILSIIGNPPSNMYVSNYSVNGVFADVKMAMPDLLLNNITAFVVVYVSCPSLSISNFPLSAFSASLIFLEAPTITSVCPDQILAQVNQFVIVQGLGFLKNGPMMCILNNTIAIPPTAVNPTSVSCNLFWPIDQQGFVTLSIANDGAIGNMKASSLNIEIMGACQSQKPGSVAGQIGCVCPIGTFDTGSSCQLCGNGQYQDQQDQPYCKQCGNNQDTNYKTGSTSLSACVCSAAYYIDPKTKKCAPCVAGMLCPGNNVILILPGYWRASNITSDVIACPGSTTSCIGNINTSSSSSYSSSLCAKGYTGPECLVCEAGYAKSGVLCSQCVNNKLNGFALFVLIVFAILLAYFLIQSTIEQNNNDNDTNNNFQSSAEKAEKQREGSLQVLLKVTLNYLQVLYYIGKLTSNWSVLTRKFFEAVGIVGALSPQTYTIQCAANWRFYDTLIFVYISPIIITSLLCVVYFVRHFLWKKSTMTIKDTATHLQLAVMLLLYQVHPTILLNVISAFPCEAIPGTGTSYLKADYSVDCKSAEYRSNAAGAAVYLIFYVIGMVVFAVYKLHHNHLSGKLHRGSHNAYFKYRFFFMGYRPDNYYWEAVIMLRKMGVVGFSVLTSPMLQLVFGNIILTISLLLNNSWKPFASYFVNRLESLALITLLATVSLGFLFLNTQSTHQDTLWISVLLIIINTAMMAVLVFYSFRYLRQYIRKLEKYLPKKWRSNSEGEDGDRDVVMTVNPRSTKNNKGGVSLL